MVGLFEVMEISQGIRELIKSGAGEEDIRRRAIPGKTPLV
jgi:type II secretory ATPase GspE/PulE/Tfp pilus assembly ATPase PilB-like protein